MNTGQIQLFLYPPPPQYTHTHRAAQQSPCPPLPDILNGFITTDDNDLGTVGTYGCNAGFVLDLSLGGSKMRTCVGGIWNNLEPSCISKSNNIYIAQCIQMTCMWEKE